MNAFVQMLEDRALFSTTLLGAEPAITPAATPAISAAVALPSLVGRYTGILQIPAMGHFKSIVLAITKQTAKGSFTGKLTTSGVAVAVTGIMKANKTFTITLKGNHVGGSINGTGTGKLSANGKTITMSLKFKQGSALFPGTISATRP